MSTTEKILALWAEGKPAPYDLYASRNLMDDVPLLVEAAGEPLPRVIAKGETISAALAAQVKGQVDPPRGEPIEVDVLVRDDDGKPVIVDGANVIRAETVYPYARDPVWLSDTTEPDVLDDACDMCGQGERELFAIGRGWYCKVPTQYKGEAEPTTCHDRRLKQLGA